MELLFYTVMAIATQIFSNTRTIIPNVQTSTRISNLVLYLTYKRNRVNLNYITTSNQSAKKNTELLRYGHMLTISITLSGCVSTSIENLKLL